jgi:hypothetical protein
MRLLAIPVWRKEILAAVIIQCHAGSQAKFLHKTIAADPFEAFGEPLTKCRKDWSVVPDIYKRIRG